MTDILKLSDKEILAIAHQLRIAYGLKRTIRYDAERSSNEHAESVAEHIFGLIFLAHYFLAHELNIEDLNRQKIFDILLFHDFAEIKYGDIVSYYKTKELVEREKRPQKKFLILSLLPSIKSDIHTGKTTKNVFLLKQNSATHSIK